MDLGASWSSGSSSRPKSGFREGNVREMDRFSAWEKVAAAG
jgi:hypothetical protein